MLIFDSLLSLITSYKVYTTLPTFNTSALCQICLKSVYRFDRYWAARQLQAHCDCLSRFFISLRGLHLWLRLERHEQIPFQKTFALRCLAYNREYRQKCTGLCQVFWLYKWQYSAKGPCHISVRAVSSKQTESLWGKGSPLPGQIKHMHWEK